MIISSHMSENNNVSGVRSVDRALLIIETLTNHRQGLGLVELSKEVGLNKSTTYRMLCAIMHRGWVSKDSLTGNYRATLKIFELSSRVSSGTNVLSITRPYLEKLSEKLGETLHLVVQDGTDVIYICKEESPIQTIKMGSRVGARNLMFVTGVGKAILCYLKEEEIKRLWNMANITPITNNTIVDLDTMLDELRLSKERGWAIDNEENEIGVRCVAVPILSSGNIPIASISVAGSVFHITPDKYEYYAGVLKETASVISKQLGI